MLGILTVTTIVFALISCILGIILTVLLHSYNRLYSDMRELNTYNENNEIRTSSQLKQVTRLANEINRLLLRMHDSYKESEEKDKELRQAIENMSHDLRTPLTSIKGYFALLKKDSLTAEEKAQYTEIISKKISALEQLITGFYELSRLQNNDYKMTHDKLSVSNILIEEIAAYYTEFERVGIEPELNIEENLPYIYGDPFVVQRVFNNLITNAIKYSDGDLRISVHLNRDKDAIITTFANKATAVDEESARHLKERFFMVDRTRTGQSTGIGLALVDTLLSNMGNSIDCAKSGDDIVFTVTWNLGDTNY